MHEPLSHLSVYIKELSIMFMALPSTQILLILKDIPPIISTCLLYSPQKGNKCVRSLGCGDVFMDIHTKQSLSNYTLQMSSIYFR